MGKNPANRYITYPVSSILVITSKRHGVHYVLFDTEDYNRIKHLHWNVEKDAKGKFYVRNSKLKLKLHRLIMETPEDLVVDHLNHNKRDNSIYNLEWVSKQENWERAMRDLISVDQNPDTGNKGDSKKNPLMFDNVDEAFAWLIQNDTAMHNQPNLNAERVKRKLMLASTNKEKYANRFWCIKK